MRQPASVADDARRRATADDAVTTEADIALMRHRAEALASAG